MNVSPQWHEIHSKKKHKREAKKKRNKTGSFGWKHQSQYSSHKNDTRVIKAPKVLSLYSKENADELLQHFDYSISSSEKKVILDFRNTETITLSGGIFLHGYIKCLEHSEIEYTVKQSKLEKIQQIVTYIQGTKKQEEITYDDIRCWKLYSFNGKMENRSAIFNYIKHELKLQNPAISDKAIVEILSNCTAHAYPDADTHQLRKFYLFLGIHPKENEKEKECTFCIFDHGIGFRKSYVRQNPEQKRDVNRLLYSKLKGEGKTIEHIIKEGKSGTRKANRGQGLNKILHMITETSVGGSLIVYSRRGFFEAYPRSKHDRETRKLLHGTLVQFSIPIN